MEMIVTLSLAVGCSYAAEQLEGNGQFIGVLCVLAAIFLLEMSLLEERDFVLTDSVFNVSAAMAVSKFKKPLHVAGVISMFCLRKVSVFTFKQMVAARELTASTQLEALQNQLAVARTDMAILKRNLAATTSEISAKELATKEMAEVMKQAAIKQKAAVDAAWHQGELAGREVAFGDERTLMRLYNESKFWIQEQTIDKNNKAFIELGERLGMTHLETSTSKLLHPERQIK